MHPIRALERLYARSRRLPVRVRIAIVSALLTAFILVGFAAVVGRLVSDRLHADFANDLKANAAALSNGIDLVFDPATQQPQVSPRDLVNIQEIARTNDAAIAVVDIDGNAYLRTEGAPSLGAPTTEVHGADGGLQVASSRILSPSFGFTGPMYVQYARPEASVDDTVSRLWLFLGGGVVIGSFLAGLAGMAVANRAMRPISSLTGVARDIATTRDPSLRIPEPETDDEVAELARTLAEMLRELDAARSETEETIKRQREFVADASHELRTPLTSVLANLEMLDESFDRGAGGDEDERAAVASALRSSQRMKRLVADLLMLARADAGRLGAKQECDLAEIAAEALEEVRPVAGSRVLEAELDATVPISGNPDEIHRMILNLLENAIRHTPGGTGIRLRVSGDGELAQVVVEDEGEGLPSGMEEQVFDRFVQGHGPADRSAAKITGTGLGLSIVKAVALAHGGDVRATNCNGPTGGARFEVTIPQAPADAPQPSL